MGCDLRGQETRGRSYPTGRAIRRHYQIVTHSQINGLGGLVDNRITKYRTMDNAAAHQRNPPPLPLRSHPRPPSACPRHTAGTIAIPAAPNPEELLLHRHAALAKLDGCHAHTSDLARSRPWFPSSVLRGPGVSGPAWIRCGPQERRRQNGDWPNSRLALFKVATHGYLEIPRTSPTDWIHNPRDYSLSG